MFVGRREVAGGRSCIRRRSGDRRYARTALRWRMDPASAGHR